MVANEGAAEDTKLGPLLAVLYMEVSLFRRFYMYTCQCKRCLIGQSNAVLLKEVAAFQRCLTV